MDGSLHKAMSPFSQPQSGSLSRPTAPFSQPQSSPGSQPQSSHVSQPQSYPVSQPQSSLFSHIRLTLRTGKPICLVQVLMISCTGLPLASPRAAHRSSVNVFLYLCLFRYIFMPLRKSCNTSNGTMYVKCGPFTSKF